MHFPVGHIKPTKNSEICIELTPVWAQDRSINPSQTLGSALPIFVYYENNPFFENNKRFLR
jgi:hypothetical protein